MPNMLSDLIKINPGFRTAVNLIQEQDDLAKADSFAPTKEAAEVLFDIERQMEPHAGRRARLITGTYGTGKSHLALVLAQLYRGHRDQLPHVLGRLHEKFAGRYAQLQQQLKRISPDCPYLVVLIEGYTDDFEATLVRGLQQALLRLGWTDLVPRTRFYAAAQRLKELQQDPEARQRLEQVCPQIYGDAVDSLIRKLESGSAQSSDLQAFEKIHQQVCFNAEFFAEKSMEAVATYQEIAQRLIDEGRALGIVVIWDEFGQFMEQVVRDPASRQALAIQRFAEACQNSRENQLHLYLITHRTLKSYVARLCEERRLSQQAMKSQEEEFEKVSGRFQEFVMESQAEEQYGLINDALIQQRDVGWEEFVRQHDSSFEILTEEAHKANLLADLTYNNLRKIVVEGCYPLAPATTAMLPAVAETVAQNQRTLFTFICSNDNHTVAQFVETTPIPAPGEPLPLIFCDRIWDYFEQQIREDQYGRKTYQRYRSALATLGSNADEESRKLVKILALFDLLREVGRGMDFPANEEMIFLAYGARSDAEKEVVREKLETFSQRGNFRIAARLTDRTYRLIAGGGTELEEVIQKTIQERQASLSVAEFLRARWGYSAASRGTPHSQGLTLGFEEKLEVLTTHPDLPQRTVEIKVLLPEELHNLHRWLSDIGGGQYKDGILFLILPTAQVEIGSVARAALEYAENPQVLFACPPQPLEGLRDLVARLEALEYIAQREPSLWGEQGERHDEWQVEYQETEKALREMLTPVALVSPATTLKLTCFWQGSPSECASEEQLRQLVERAMVHVFSLSPRAKEEFLRSSASGSGGLKSAQREVIDTLLEPKPLSRNLEALAQEKNQARARLVRLLEKLGMLKKHNTRYSLVPPEAEADPGAHALWTYLTGIPDKAREGPYELKEIVHTLRSAPYGLGPFVLPLFLAVALHKNIRNGNLLLKKRARANGEYQLISISGEALDEAVRNPEAYRFEYVDITEQQNNLIAALYEALGGHSSSSLRGGDLLEETQNQVVRWWGNLPRYCQNTASLSVPAKFLRDEILRPLTLMDSDPQKILIDRLQEKVDPKQPISRESFKQEFEKLIDEIENACSNLLPQVAEELSRVLEWGEDKDPGAVTERLRAWYAALPEATRQWNHSADAGKLQQWLRSPESALDKLCESIMGKPLLDWSDNDPGHFAGRLQSAMQSLAEWEPPVPVSLDSPMPETLPSGSARLSVVAQFKDRPLNLTRRFHIIEPEELSEPAKILLRLLRSNLAEDVALADGEKETVLLELIRQVFGDG